MNSPSKNKSPSRFREKLNMTPDAKKIRSAFREVFIRRIHSNRHFLQDSQRSLKPSSATEITMNELKDVLLSNKIETAQFSHENLMNMIMEAQSEIEEEFLEKANEAFAFQQQELESMLQTLLNVCIICDKFTQNESLFCDSCTAAHLSSPTL